tara:strand:+ start:486 stop:785 length:300 start_codon:yes stop_codon:yes gene_type:complete
MKRPINLTKLKQYSKLIVPFLFFSLFPWTANAEPWDFFSGATTFLTSTLGRSIAIFVVGCIGIAWYFNRLEKETAIKFVGATGLLFGGAAIVDLITSWM